MQPKRETLLKTIRKSVASLAMQVDRSDSQALLNVIDTCANELLLRENKAFYLDYCHSGEELLSRLVGRDRGDALPPLDQSSDADAIDDRISFLARSFQSIVEAKFHGTDVTSDGWFDAIEEWELRLYARRLQDAGGRVDGPDAISAAKLEAYLRNRSGIPDLTLEKFHPIPGGFSKFTYLFDTYDAHNGRQEMVARVEPPVLFMDLDGMDLANEYPILQYAHAAGLPVAEPLWFEADPAALGSRFIVSRRVAGDIFGTVKDVARALPDDAVRMLAQTLARVHATPLDSSDPLLANSHLARWLSFPTMRENTAAFIEYWARQRGVDAAEASPLFALAIEWLRANVPADEFSPCLIHGDVGLHNMMILEGKLQALLDWENSRAGDPAEDFAHFFNGVGDHVDQKHFLRLYYEAGGREISEFRLRYFKVYSLMNNGIACLITLARMDKYARCNVNWSVYGLKFAHNYLSKVREAIRSADAAKS